jgi:VIT1/CCC1 family predicted Fe2+/Mn2+ transporter
MPDDEGENPAKSGAITFGSFIIFGTIPLLAYLDASKDTSGSRFDVRFMISIVLTALTLFALGCLKGRFVGQSSIISGFYMLVNGGAAALASFIISFAVESALT